MSESLRSNTSTTWDAAVPGLLLRVTIEDGMYHVTDFVGTRYGVAPFLGDALAEWMSQVDDILALQGEPLGAPLKYEVAAYKRALSR